VGPVVGEPLLGHGPALAHGYARPVGYAPPPPPHAPYHPEPYVPTVVRVNYGYDRGYGHVGFGHEAAPGPVAAFGPILGRPF
jgi:hypothetical protein